MPSTVGKQSTEKGVLEAAIKLELDCVAAYGQAAKRSRSADQAASYRDFTQDCRNHATKWQAALTSQGGNPAVRGNCLTEPLNSFKVRAASFFAGDRGIASAVHNNPNDCQEAYARVMGRGDLSEHTRLLAASFLQDARKHGAWVEELLHPVPAADGAR